MLGQNFTSIVEVCLTRLDRGENLPDVLADYPAYQDRLKPLLLVAMASRAIDVPLPNDSTRRMGRNQMLAEMDQMGSKGYLHRYVGFTRVQSWIRDLVNTLRAKALVNTVPSYRLAVVALTIAFGIGLFAVSASASNLPGGLLGSFSSDFRQALGVFDIDQTGPERERLPALIFSGDDLQLGGSRAAKVAFLLDLLTTEEEFGFSLGNQVAARETGPAVGDGGEDSSDLQDDPVASTVPDQDGDKLPPDSQDDPVVSTVTDQDGDEVIVLPDGIVDNPGLTIAPGLDDGLDDDQDVVLPPGIVDNPGLVIAPGLQDEDTADQDADEDEKDKKDKKDKNDKKDKIGDVEEGESGE